MNNTQVVSNWLWTELIDTALETQKYYLNLNNEQFNWLKNELIHIYENNILTIKLKYKCLVLLNRTTKCGRYALLFNKKIEESVLNMDKDYLLQTLLNPPLDELDCLPTTERDKWIQEIEKHILALNLYIDRKIIIQNEIYNFDQKICYFDCYKDVCSFKSDFVCITPQNIIQFSENLDFQEKNIMMEIDLIFLILSKSCNPYTNNNFTQSFLNLFNQNYCDILLVCKNAFRLGYQHTYKI